VTAGDGTYRGSASFPFTVAAPVVNGAVTLYNSGWQQSTQGQAVSLAARASDSSGAALNYSVQGLPSTLSINPTTGVIRGTFSPGGAYSYRVTVQAGDGASTAQVSFRWNVQSPSA
jgi:hypothetical protein